MSNTDKGIIRVVKNKDNPYVIINKEFLDNDNLSWKAKGILSYLLSKPDDWQVNTFNLINKSSEGKTSVYSGLKELKEHGYLKKYPVYKKGRITHWESIIYETPNLSIVEKLKEAVNADNLKSVSEDLLLPEKLEIEKQKIDNREDLISNDSKINIDITKSTTTDKNETNVVVDIFTITSFYDRIKNKIGVAVSKKAIEEMIQKRGETEINKYIDNWDKFSGTKKKTVAGFFKSAVMTGYVIPESDVSEGKVKEEWERPIESDEYYNSFCENGGSEWCVIGAMSYVMYRKKALNYIM